MSHIHIKERKFSFCPTISGFDLNRLIVQCSFCTSFFAACCEHGSFGGDWYEPEQRACHHLQLVFTDGACSNNGRGYAAKAGLGIVIGDDDSLSWSITVDDTLDTAPRTSQRAELLAAIEGLKKLELTQKCSDMDANQDYRAMYIVVTDSEYVVKGISEWFPKWRNSGWRRTDGRQPANLDLFMKLNEYTTILEQDRVAVGFWHVPRAYNYRADKLAKEAARV